MSEPPICFLFVLNPGSGSKKSTEWKPLIQKYFEPLSHPIHFYHLTGKNDESLIQKDISKIKPDRVIAVGGDGTVSLVGKILTGTGIPMGILPGGSANGMAAEIGIPNKPEEALKVIISSHSQPCDAIRINKDHYCFHLSDLGINAQMIKYFEDSNMRGMWNYGRMLIKALVNKRLMNVKIKMDGKTIQTNAYMVVIANASKYGTGATINPDSQIGDGKFEVVIVKRIALSEFVKLFWSYKSFNPEKVEIFETTKLNISSRKKIHFQVDGEYLGRVSSVEAMIIPSAVQLFVNADIETTN